MSTASIVYRVYKKTQCRRSTRPDVVSVTPIESKLGECSDKAEIRATAKAVSGELSAVIFAEDSGMFIYSFIY